ncbi:MAG TPA: nucleotidyltransferase [Patescibacteria group bacterium]|nr:nucleotidyltransferase [Patescibacteria group bacterium]
MTRKAEEFYIQALKLLNKSGIPFMLGGTMAVKVYTDIERETKDMDIFVKPGDYPRVLNMFTEAGYKTSVEDERWLAKVRHNGTYFDVIFNLQNAQSPVNDNWFTESQIGTLFGIEIKLLPPAELILAKAFVQDRDKYEGSDIAHLILLKHKDIDWKRLLDYMEQYWEVLLIHLLNFRFIYPSERESVPKEILNELLSRLMHQAAAPTPKNKICRGRIFSLKDYYIDVSKFGFGDVIGGDVHESRIPQS